MSPLDNVFLVFISFNFVLFGGGGGGGDDADDDEGNKCDTLRRIGAKVPMTILSNDAFSQNF